MAIDDIQDILSTDFMASKSKKPPCKSDVWYVQWLTNLNSRPLSKYLLAVKGYFDDLSISCLNADEFEKLDLHVDLPIFADLGKPMPKNKAGIFENCFSAFLKSLNNRARKEPLNANYWISVKPNIFVPAI